MMGQGWGVSGVFIQQSRRMLRSLLLRPRKTYTFQFEEEVLFPDIGKQNNRQTLNSCELFENVGFARMGKEGELVWDVSWLQSYGGDRLRFVARVEVNEGKLEEEQNEILLVREPVFSSEDVITFLLVLKWFPNAMKTYKLQRKSSFSNQRQVRQRQRKTESAELLQLVFLLSQKLYIPERFVDDFLHLIGERSAATAKQANCLTVVLSASHAKDHYLSTNFTSSQSQHTQQYQEYIYDNRSTAANRFDQRHSQHSAESYTNTLALFKRKSARNSDKSPPRNSDRSPPRNSDRSPRFAQRSLRQSQAHSVEMEQGPKRHVVGCNLSKAKSYFSAVQYLITESEVGVEMIMCHLNDDRNTINCGFSLQTVATMLKEWPRYCLFPSLYELNRELTLRAQLAQSLANYRTVASMQLSQVGSISVQAIYVIVRQLNSKAMAQFLAATKQFTHHPTYNQCIGQLEVELCALQAELINNYAIGKLQQGRRVLKDLQKRKGRKGALQNCLLMRLIGREEVGTLEMGFKMYRQLLDGKLEQSFRQLSQGNLRGRINFTGNNNDQDMLANIQGRIQICQEKRKMLQAAIALSEKEGDSLQMMMRNFDHNPAHTELLSAFSETQE